MSHHCISCRAIALRCCLFRYSCLLDADLSSHQSYVIASLSLSDHIVSVPEESDRHELRRTLQK